MTIFQRVVLVFFILPLMAVLISCGSDDDSQPPDSDLGKGIAQELLDNFDIYVKYYGDDKLQQLSADSKVVAFSKRHKMKLLFVPKSPEVLTKIAELGFEADSASFLSEYRFPVDRCDGQVSPLVIIVIGNYKTGVDIPTAIRIYYRDGSRKRVSFAPFDLVETDIEQDRDVVSSENRADDEADAQVACKDMTSYVKSARLVIGQQAIDLDVSADSWQLQLPVLDTRPETRDKFLDKNEGMFLELSFVRYYDGNSYAPSVKLEVEEEQQEILNIGRSVSSTTKVGRIFVTTGVRVPLFSYKAGEVSVRVMVKPKIGTGGYVSYDGGAAKAVRIVVAN